MKTIRLRWSALAAALLLAACTHPAATLPAINASDDAACALDGMLLRDFPGPKAQVRLTDGKTEYFCDVMELLSEMLAPEQRRAISAFYVQDMGKADWRQPRGHWLAARDALYVFGSDAQGSMGAAIAPFSQQADADAFVQKHGGKVLRFEQIKPDMLNSSRGGMPAHGIEH
ncbi:nitrous oxide reductase accessory protein NosL [Duganella sp. P38]|jgi:copper chaperone NosL|uniref:nitrous oxide reductase accessory protein NosL n=1 Tax=Duganella sp. P38 TaxID=3423949 RepID=UPI003D796EFF